MAERGGTRRELSDSSRTVLLWIADQLRAGFTGTLEIECRDGGVRQVRPSQVLIPRDGSMVPRSIHRE